MLKGKTVLLGVTGSIAAYKTASLASMLVKKGVKVHVLMTKNAAHFINPITFESLTGNKCLVDTFDRNFEFSVEHVALAKQADVVMIAPASANVIGKIAHGIADDMLTTTVMACRCKKILAPAMNTNMYENPILQDNLDICRRYGMEVITPAWGYLACGDTGAGKMPEPEVLYEYILREAGYPGDLAGRRILVTAGPTDRVTYQGSRQEEQVLYLYFDMNYTAMKAEREILCRAALTRTLTQIEGIDYINIYCGDQPLMDRQGNPVGMLSATDFIMNTSNVNAYEKTELTLYFADETGNRLVPEKREVVHNINTSLEQLVVEQLIAGPGQEGHNPTLPSDCKILSLSVTDNVCYINFDSAFANTTLAVNEYIPIYSIVDSLSEMTTVTKVQIMINGSQDVMFRDVVSLNTTFERSQNYIDGKNE